MKKRRDVQWVLASQSPRRAQLLAEAGVPARVVVPHFKDPDQPECPWGDVAQVSLDEIGSWVASLARQKAESLRGDAAIQGCPVLAADTVCVTSVGHILGKPSDAEDARQMLNGLIAQGQHVISGVAMMEPSGAMIWCHDIAHVKCDGELPQGVLDRWLESKRWQGKAGGYNLADVQQDGWPLKVDGDPTTVMGLPMQMIMPLLMRGLQGRPLG